MTLTFELVLHRVKISQRAKHLAGKIPKKVVFPPR